MFYQQKTHYVIEMISAGGTKIPIPPDQMHAENLPQAGDVIQFEKNRFNVAYREFIYNPDSHATIYRIVVNFMPEAIDKTKKK